MIQDFIKLVDYTMLSPDSTEDDIISLCERAIKYGVATVCVLPKMVTIAKLSLQNSKVKITTVVSFPEGINSKESKIKECRQALNDGADDIDMVLNYQKLISDWHYEGKDGGDIEIFKFDSFVDEVANLAKLCHINNKILKVIVESGRLTEKQTKIATYICLDAGADFIKTSTGMVEIGAELDKIKIMSEFINNEKSTMKIKASGGIRTIKDMETFAPYVDRFGVGSSSIDKILSHNNSEEDTY